MPYHPSALSGESQRKTSASTNTEAPWEPVRLKPEHVEMIKQAVQGIPPSRIAFNFKRYGVRYSNRQISRVLDSAKGREFASLYSAQLHGGIAGLTYQGMVHAPEAFYTELDIMRNPFSGERHRLAAAQDVMDRVGPAKVSRQETEQKTPTTIVLNITASQLSQFHAPITVIEAVEVPLLENPSSADDE